jgi:hypothetical protein
MCVVAMVERKVRNRERICESCRLHDLSERIGADIDVHPVGRTRTADWDIEIPDGLITQETPPVFWGTTIGPETGTRPTGTLGALVLKGNKQYILSNNHVLAGVRGTVDNHAIGLDPGVEIMHPGAADPGPNPAIRIARLADPGPELKLSRFQQTAPHGINTVDAAIAEVDPPGSVQPFAHLIGAIQQNPLPLDALEMGRPVMKVGRTTGLTHGRFIGVAAETPAIGYNIDRDALGNVVQAFGFFSNVLVIQSEGGTMFSNRGDSGSVIVTDNMKPRAIGLLFAGGSTNQAANVTFAIPMELVFSTLGIDRFINDE